MHTFDKVLHTSLQRLQGQEEPIALPFSSSEPSLLQSPSIPSASGIDIIPCDPIVKQLIALGVIDEACMLPPDIDQRILPTSIVKEKVREVLLTPLPWGATTTTLAAFMKQEQRAATSLGHKILAFKIVGSLASYLLHDMLHDLFSCRLGSAAATLLLTGAPLRRLMRRPNDWDTRSLSDTSKRSDLEDRLSAMVGHPICLDKKSSPAPFSKCVPFLISDYILVGLGSNVDHSLCGSELQRPFLFTSSNLELTITFYTDDDLEFDVTVTSDGDRALQALVDKALGILRDNFPEPLTLQIPSIDYRGATAWLSAIANGAIPMTRGLFPALVRRLIDELPLSYPHMTTEELWSWRLSSLLSHVVAAHHQADSRSLRTILLMFESLVDEQLPFQKIWESLFVNADDAIVLLRLRHRYSALKICYFLSITSMLAMALPSTSPDGTVEIISLEDKVALRRRLSDDPALYLIVPLPEALPEVIGPPHLLAEEERTLIFTLLEEYFTPETPEHSCLASLKRLSSSLTTKDMVAYAELCLKCQDSAFHAIALALLVVAFAISEDSYLEEKLLTDVIPKLRHEKGVLGRWTETTAIALLSSRASAEQHSAISKAIAASTPISWLQALTATHYPPYCLKAAVIALNLLANASTSLQKEYWLWAARALSRCHDLDPSLLHRLLETSEKIDIFSDSYCKAFLWLSRECRKKLAHEIPRLCSCWKHVLRTIAIDKAIVEELLVLSSSAILQPRDVVTLLIPAMRSLQRSHTLDLPLCQRMIALIDSDVIDKKEYYEPWCELLQYLIKNDTDSNLRNSYKKRLCAADLSRGEYVKAADTLIDMIQQRSDHSHWGPLLHKLLDCDYEKAIGPLLAAKKQLKKSTGEILSLIRDCLQNYFDKAFQHHTSKQQQVKPLLFDKELRELLGENIWSQYMGLWLQNHTPTIKELALVLNEMAPLDLKGLVVCCRFLASLPPNKPIELSEKGFAFLLSNLDLDGGEGEQALYQLLCWMGCHHPQLTIAIDSVKKLFSLSPAVSHINAKAMSNETTVATALLPSLDHALSAMEYLYTTYKGDEKMLAHEQHLPHYLDFFCYSWKKSQGSPQALFWITLSKKILQQTKVPAVSSTKLLEISRLLSISEEWSLSWEWHQLIRPSIQDTEQLLWMLLLGDIAKKSLQKESSITLKVALELDNIIPGDLDTITEGYRLMALAPLRSERLLGYLAPDNRAIELLSGSDTDRQRRAHTCCHLFVTATRYHDIVAEGTLIALYQLLVNLADNKKLWPWLHECLHASVATKKWPLLQMIINTLLEKKEKIPKSYIPILLSELLSSIEFWPADNSTASNLLTLLMMTSLQNLSCSAETLSALYQWLFPKSSSPSYEQITDQLLSYLMQQRPTLSEDGFVTAHRLHVCHLLKKIDLIEESVKNPCREYYQHYLKAITELHHYLDKMIAAQLFLPRGCCTTEHMWHAYKKILTSMRHLYLLRELVPYMNMEPSTKNFSYRVSYLYQRIIDAPMAICRKEQRLFYRECLLKVDLNISINKAYIELLLAHELLSRHLFDTPLTVIAALPGRWFLKRVVKLQIRSMEPARPHTKPQMPLSDLVIQYYAELLVVLKKQKDQDINLLTCQGLHLIYFMYYSWKDLNENSTDTSCQVKYKLVFNCFNRLIYDLFLDPGYRELPASVTYKWLESSLKIGFFSLYPQQGLMDISQSFLNIYDAIIERNLFSQKQRDNLVWLAIRHRVIDTATLKLSRHSLSKTPSACIHDHNYLYDTIINNTLLQLQKYRKSGDIALFKIFMKAFKNSKEAFCNLTAMAMAIDTFIALEQAASTFDSDAVSETCFHFAKSHSFHHHGGEQPYGKDTPLFSFQELLSSYWNQHRDIAIYMLFLNSLQRALLRDGRHATSLMTTISTLFISLSHTYSNHHYALAAIYCHLVTTTLALDDRALMLYITFLHAPSFQRIYKLLISFPRIYQRYLFFKGEDTVIPELHKADQRGVFETLLLSLLEESSNWFQFNRICSVLCHFQERLYKGEGQLLLTLYSSFVDKYVELVEAGIENESELFVDGQRKLFHSIYNIELPNANSDIDFYLHGKRSLLLPQEYQTYAMLHQINELFFHNLEKKYEITLPSKYTNEELQDFFTVNMASFFLAAHHGAYQQDTTLLHRQMERLFSLSSLYLDKEKNKTRKDGHIHIVIECLNHFLHIFENIDYERAPQTLAWFSKVKQKPPCTK